MSKSGHPQIMLVFQDREAREITQMITLSETAAWVLARILGCCDPPANLARMESDGVEPEHFADEGFADRILLDRQLNIDVVASKKPDYPDVVPVKLPPAATQQAPSTASPLPSNAPPAAPPPPAAVSPSSSPPDVAPPIGLTKDEAWAKVLAVWEDGTDELKQLRNQAWLDTIESVGKPEPEFTPADWLTIAHKMQEKANIPF
ncbi:MAG: hypothetical protein ABII12_10925 [Planctomycetota bacterium]